VSVTLTVIASAGLVLALVYSLWLVDRVLYGPASRGFGIADLRPHEIIVVALLAAGILWVGLMPQPFLDLAGPAIAGLLPPGGMR